MSGKFYTNVSIAKNDILLVGYENGHRVIEKVPYSPYLFVPGDEGSRYKTIDGAPVEKIQFDTIMEGRDFVKRYNEVDNYTIYGMDTFQYPFIFDYYPGEIEYDPSLISVCSIDIEVDIADEKGFPSAEQAENEITLITISRNGRKSVFGCQPYNNQREDVKYYHCKDEIDLLTKFLRCWNSTSYSPDVITGWNIEFFDIPYIVNRIRRVLGEKFAKSLSPWNYLRERKVARAFGGEDQVWDIVGVTTLDYLALYKKFTYSQQESYKLDHIAFVEVGARKLDYGEYGSLAGLQTNNWQMYVDYNIRDDDLVVQIDDKLKLIELVFAMAYDAKVNFQDTLATVRPWDVIIHNYLLERNIVVPPMDIPEYNEGIIGGYVKDPQCGMHNWVVSLDLNSLYPHIIMQYNISPETYRGKLPTEYIPNAASKIEFAFNRHFTEHRDYLLDNNVTCTANLLTFTREFQGFLPALMSKYYDERTIYKGKMIEAKKQLEKNNPNDDRDALLKLIARYDNMQMAKKIQLNSAYGALGNRFFRWHRNEFAEAITSSGQLSTRWIERDLNEYINKALGTTDVDYVIACDTDSVYIKLGDVVDQIFPQKGRDKKKILDFMDNLCIKQLEPFIDKKYQALADYVNAFEQKMKMKRECIADKGIWTAKKHYILNVYNQEGVAYTEPKLKMMGIEAIRSSTPQVCRDAIKKALSVIMNEDEASLQKFIRGFLEEFNTFSFGQIASPRSVSDIDKYADRAIIFKKGTPINCKGALIYNHHLKQLKLDKKYESIASGQKIKYAYCIEPNPLRCSVIAAPNDLLPPEFNMDKYLDRYKQYQKSFLEPIKTITNTIGWEVEKRATLSSFFGE